jgi:glycosyltransferase involved in cell wall biosynthesis
MFFSVIVINYNNGIGFERTLTSIERQGYVDREVVVVDGGSTDGSLALIEKFGYIICTAIVGKDKGIYDAMNLGIDNARGEYLIFLNSGDTFASDVVLEEVFALIRRKKKRQGEVVFGFSVIVEGKQERLFPKSRTMKVIKHLPWTGLLFLRLPTHQAMFFPVSICRVLKYNTRYKVSADRDFKIRSFDRCGYLVYNKPVCYFYNDGVSSSFRNIDNAFRRLVDSMIVSSRELPITLAIASTLDGILRILKRMVLLKKRDSST